MKPALATGLPFEVLDYVRNIGGISRNTRFQKRIIQNAASRTHEGPAFQIFFVARLFADEHEGRPHESLSENRLGCVPVQITSATARCGVLQRSQVDALRKKIFGRYHVGVAGCF